MEIIIVLISSKNTENNRSPVTPNIKHKYQYWKKAHKYIGFCKKKRKSEKWFIRKQDLLYK